MIVLKYFLKNIHINNIKMLYYDRIDVCESTDVNKTSVQKGALFVTFGIF